MTFVAELEPTAVWQHFDKILTIPRASKDEERMRAHVVALGPARGPPCPPAAAEGAGRARR